MAKARVHANRESREISHLIPAGYYAGSTAVKPTPPLNCNATPCRAVTEPEVAEKRDSLDVRLRGTRRSRQPVP